MSETGCAVCSTTVGEFVVEENGYTGKRCAECDTIYVSPRPSEAEIRELYDEYQSERSLTDLRLNRWKQRLTVRNTLNCIERWQPGGSLLEIGAGTGHFVDEARSSYDVYATELDADAADFIESDLEIPCENGPVAPDVYGDQQFDVVYHRNVISHFHDPVAELETMADLLDDDGVLVFETGNFAEVDERFYSSIPSFQYPDHLFLFGETGLERLLTDTGFEIVEIRRYSMMPYFRFLGAIEPIKERVESLVAEDDPAPVAATDGGTSEAHAHGVARAETAPADASPAVEPTPPDTESAEPGVLYTLLSSLWTILTFLLQYGLGRIAPKSGRPQTMIVVAEKRSG